MASTDEPTDKPEITMLDYGREPRPVWYEGAVGLLLAVVMVVVGVLLGGLGYQELRHAYSSSDPFGIAIGVTCLATCGVCSVVGFCMGWVAVIWHK